MTTRLGLSASFTDLGFRGAVEIVESGDFCVYRFEGFEFAFVSAPDPRVTKTVQLTHFRLSAYNETSPQRHYLPFDAELSLANPIAPAFNGSFSISRTVVLASEYLTFAVTGWFHTEMHDEELCKIVGKRKRDGAVWPITARSNQIEEERPRFGPIRYRQPLDPNDCCAPERVR